MDDIQNRLSVLSQDKKLLVEALKKKRLRGELQELQGEIPPISRVPRNGMLPLSFAQQRMWLLHELDPDTPTYNDHLAVRFIGRLNIEVLERSFAEVIRRHETLRTIFHVVDGQPVQVIGPQVQFALPMIDLRHYPENEREIEERNLCLSEVAKPFDLAQGPLLRTRLLWIADGEYVLIIVLPHIIFDGWSRGILVQELTALYEAYLSGRPSPLAELPIQYADFACWQREWLQGEVLDNQVAYWREQLGGQLPALDLPADHPRPPVQSYRGANLTCGISRNVKESLEELGRKQQSTLFIVLLAAFQTLLHRYTGQEDLIIGVPTANRTRGETERLIGAFVNTLALRVNLSSDLPFQELLSRTRKVALQAQAYQDVPFEKLVELLSPQRDLSRTPLFQVMFVLQNVPMPKVQMPGVTLSHVSLHSGTAQFDLTLFLFDGPEGSLIASMDYNTDLFEAQRILRMLMHFQVLLEGIVADPEQRLANLPLLTTEELHQLTHEWNDTRFEYAREVCIHELFETQVTKCPNAVAVLYEDRRLTYSELDRRANQLANYLCKRGTGPETLIGICMERSLEMVIGLLAILKSGAAYVPLDPGYPAERLSYMLSDSGIGMVVTQDRFRQIFSSSDAELICLDEDWAKVSGEDERCLKNTSRSQNLVYVIYTSGSTGKPKGAMNTHGGLRNRLEWMQHRYQLEAGDRVLQKTPFTFDVSVWEFFWPLLTGAQLVMARPGGHKDSEYLIEAIQHFGITTLHFVPPMLQVWLGTEGVENCRSLKRVISSGEALSIELQRKFEQKLSAELHNLYGPTEASIDVTYWECLREWQKEFVPIGRPVRNTQVYVLDGEMELVPV
jgi:amino acid adenylation domain-containing protein